MHEAALQRRAALRTLYEKYGVGFELMARATNLKTISVKRLAKREGWIALSTGALRGPLMRAIRKLIEGAKDDGVSAADVERTARAYLATTRSLDAIDAALVPIGAVQKESDVADHDLDDEETFQDFECVLDQAMEKIRERRERRALRGDDASFLSGPSDAALDGNRAQ